MSWRVDSAAKLKDRFTSPTLSICSRRFSMARFVPSAIANANLDKICSLSSAKRSVADSSTRTSKLRIAASSAVILSSASWAVYVNVYVPTSIGVPESIGDMGLGSNVRPGGTLSRVYVNSPNTASPSGFSESKLPPEAKGNTKSSIASPSMYVWLATSPLKLGAPSTVM